MERAEDVNARAQPRQSVDENAMEVTSVSKM